MEPCIPGKEKKDRGVDGERQKIKEKKSRQREKQGQIDREREGKKIWRERRIQTVLVIGRSRDIFVPTAATAFQNERDTFVPPYGQDGGWFLGAPAARPEEMKLRQATRTQVLFLTKVNLRKIFWCLGTGTTSSAATLWCIRTSTGQAHGAFLGYKFNNSHCRLIGSCLRAKGLQLPRKTLYCPGTGSSSSSINGVSSPGDPAAAGTFQQHRESPNGGGGKEKCKIKRRRRERDEWATSHEGPCSGNSSENVARKIWFSWVSHQNKKIK
ncbi:hypothetical protein RUM44_005895 [Polyplax serrata]|uniref:Uncharacterized protein n=1 Tax=Polyplax serrata TaxID=468196 RepID=A0ABR1AYD8_POLSC